MHTYKHTFTYTHRYPYEELSFVLSIEFSLNIFFHFNTLLFQILDNLFLKMNLFHILISMVYHSLVLYGYRVKHNGKFSQNSSFIRTFL